MAAVPATVVALLSTVPQLGPLPPNPIAWAETPLAWTIILEDGRKLRFEKVLAEQSVEDKPAKGGRKPKAKHETASVPHVP